MTKILLALMVRNENKIIERCLGAALPHVDATLICDTGSVDNAIEVAKRRLAEKPFHIEEMEWKDFGHNRTLTLNAARRYAEQLN